MLNPQFMVDHHFTRRRLSAYVDDELDSAERRRVEHHIGECRDCDRVARSLRRMLGGLALLRRCAPSRLAGDVRQRLRDRAPTRW